MCADLSFIDSNPATGNKDANGLLAQVLQQFGKQSHRYASDVVFDCLLRHLPDTIVSRGIGEFVAGPRQPKRNRLRTRPPPRSIEALDQSGFHHQIPLKSNKLIIVPVDFDRLCKVMMRKFFNRKDNLPYQIHITFHLLSFAPIISLFIPSHEGRRRAPRGPFTGLSAQRCRPVLQDGSRRPPPHPHSPVHGASRGSALASVSTAMIRSNRASILPAPCRSRWFRTYSLTHSRPRVPNLTTP